MTKSKSEKSFGIKKFEPKKELDVRKCNIKLFHVNTFCNNHKDHHPFTDAPRFVQGNQIRDERSTKY